MKANFYNGITERESTVKSGGVVIAPNLKKETILLDKYGNEIDPRTKQIISKAEKEE